MCEKPRPFPENLTVLEIYSHRPVIPIPMTDGLVMLDLRAVEFLMKLYDVDEYEQQETLKKLQKYHSCIYDKEGAK